MFSERRHRIVARVLQPIADACVLKTGRTVYDMWDQEWPFDGVIGWWRTVPTAVQVFK